MDFLSFIGEGEEQPPQARGRPRARGRGRGNSGRPVASAMEVLALIGEGDEQSPQARNPRGRPRARGRGRGNSGRPVGSAMEVLAVIGEGHEQPPQERKPVGRPRGRPTGKRKYNHLERVRNQQKVLRFQMQRFNISGRAVNMDGLMIDAAPLLGKRDPRPKVKTGSGGWTRYLPETIMRMAFTAGPARQVAASFDDAHRHSQGTNRSPACVLQSRAVCARAIGHVQERCLQVLYERSTKFAEGSHLGSRTICLMKPRFGTFCLARAIGSGQLCCITSRSLGAKAQPRLMNMSSTPLKHSAVIPQRGSGQHYVRSCGQRNGLRPGFMAASRRRTATP